MKKMFLLIAVLFAFITASYAEDSPLVKAAKKEKERREKTEARKTLTNQDVEEIRKKQPVSGIETSATETEASTETAEATTSTASTEKKEKVDPSQTEEYWRGRKQDVDARVQDAQSRVEQIQSEINSLTAAFYAEGDGVAQRPLIESERIERIKELEAARQALNDAKAEAEGLEDEARKAGALPGWLRD
jgi:hypothetical protein